MKTLTTFAGLKKGQKFKVVNYGGSHNYPLNTVFTLNKDGAASSSMTNCVKEFSGGNSLPASAIILVGGDTVQDMKKEIADLENQIKDISEKIHYCQKIGVEEYDENVFKVYKVLQVLKTKDTDIERAKIISKLISE